MELRWFRLFPSVICFTCWRSPLAVGDLFISEFSCLSVVGIWQRGLAFWRKGTLCAVQRNEKERRLHREIWEAATRRSDVQQSHVNFDLKTRTVRSCLEEKVALNVVLSRCTFRSAGRSLIAWNGGTPKKAAMKEAPTNSQPWALRG